MTSGVPDRRVVEVVDSGRPVIVSASGRAGRAPRAARRAARRRGGSPPSGSRPAGCRSTSSGTRGADAVEVVERQVDRRAGRRSPAGARPRWSSRRSRPARRSRCGTSPCVRNVLGRRSAATSSTASRPVPCAASSSRLSGAGVPATPGTIVPSASATSAIVEAVPMVLQCPRLRIIADSDAGNCSWPTACRRAPPRDSRHTSVPQPSGVPAEGAGQHRAAGHDDGGQVDRCGGHQQRRDRLVAAAQQHDAVDRVGPQHLLGGHRRHVAPQHRGRPHLRLAERHHRQVRAGCRRPRRRRCLHRRRHLVQVGVARGQVRGGVGDRDLRAAVEGVDRARRGASRPGGCRRCGPRPRTTGRCGASPLSSFQQSTRGSNLWNAMKDTQTYEGSTDLGVGRLNRRRQQPTCGVGPGAGRPQGARPVSRRGGS